MSDFTDTKIIKLLLKEWKANRDDFILVSEDEYIEYFKYLLEFTKAMMADYIIEASLKKPLHFRGIPLKVKRVPGKGTLKYSKYWGEK